MKRTGGLLLGLCLALSTFAAAEEWSKTYTIGAKPDLRVETSDANIQVDGWDQNRIEAHVSAHGDSIGENGVRIVEHQTGDAVEIEVHIPHHYGIAWNGRNHRVDIEVHMPREGRVRLHTGDGRIRLDNFKGEADVESGDGGIEATSIDGALRAHTGDGHIRASGRFDELDAKSGDGHIEIRVNEGSTLARDWSVHTGDGSVTLNLPQSLAADVDLHTGDGHIDLEVPVTVEGKLDRNNVRGKLNGGGKLLLVHTGDGSIRIEKIG
jgi:DUF4097 and DUF4098 domain-containing protein YvlB